MPKGWASICFYKHLISKSNNYILKHSSLYIMHRVEFVPITLSSMVKSYGIVCARLMASSQQVSCGSSNCWQL